MSDTLGIDVGSVAVKVVRVSDGRPAGWHEEPTRANITEQCRRLLEQFGPAVRVGATGYGRHLVEGADLRVNEIMANAFGAGWLQRHWGSLEDIFDRVPVPDRFEEPVGTIVDVGGQDSKVITFDTDGMVRDFAMNDRCAAGTGRFLEVMAGVLEVDLPGLDDLALGASAPCRITNACTVFAESEVVSLLSEGAARGSVAAGVFESIADQVAGLAERCTWRPPALFDGGPSRSRALALALGRRLGSEVFVPPGGQFATALGAALAAGSGREPDQLTASGQPVS